MSAMTDNFEYLFETTEMLKEGVNKALGELGKPLVPGGSPLRAYAEALLGDAMTIPEFIASLVNGNRVDAFYVSQPTFMGEVALYRDLDMTLPVENIGDPVVVRVDFSGNGNHAYEPLSGYRAIYNVVNGRHVIDSRGVMGFSLITDRALNLRNGFIATRLEQTNVTTWPNLITSGTGGLGAPTVRAGHILHQGYDLINNPSTINVNEGAIRLRMLDGVAWASQAGTEESTIASPESFSRRGDLEKAKMHYNYAANDPRYQITGLLGPMVLSESGISVEDSGPLLEWMNSV